MFFGIRAEKGFYAVGGASSEPRNSDAGARVVVKDALYRVEHPRRLVRVGIDDTEQQWESRHPVGEWSSLTIDRIEIWVTVKRFHGRNGSCFSAALRGPWG